MATKNKSKKKYDFYNKNKEWKEKVLNENKRKKNLYTDTKRKCKNLLTE